MSELEELKNLVRLQVDEARLRESQQNGQLQQQLEALHGERQSLVQQLADAQAEITKQVSLARELAAGVLAEAF